MKKLLKSRWGWRMLVLCIMAIMVCGTKSEAATQQEALQWVKSQVGKSIDTDGYPAEQPYQCVDLIKAYYSYLGVSSVNGNGKDYATNSLPSGWTRLQGATPQPGDILVYSGNDANPYGHVAVFESTYSTYHQNFASHPYVERITYAYNGLSNPYWGVVRPAFSSPAVTPNITGVTPNATVSDTGIVNVSFTGVSNVHHYDILLLNTSGDIIFYKNISTTTSGSIQITTGCNNYYVCIRAYGSDGTYTNSQKVALTYMGKKVNLGDEFFVNIKTATGKYCFYSWTTTEKLDVDDEIYTSAFSSYVYRFVSVPSTNEYKIYSVGYDKIIGQFAIYDDGKGEGYLLAKSGTNQVYQYKEAKQEADGYSPQKVELETYNPSLGTQQKMLLSNFEKCPAKVYPQDFYGFWDGEAHSATIHEPTAYSKIYYRTSETSEWSTELPTRTDVGTTKVYYKITDPCYEVSTECGYITIADECLIKFETRYNGLRDVIDGKHARSMLCTLQTQNITKFESYKVITSVVKDGKLVTQEKEYGPITIEAGQTRQAPKFILIDPIYFENATGVYTTTVYVTAENGKKYQGSISYDFATFRDDVVSTMRVGDEFTDDNIYRMFLIKNEVVTGEAEIVSATDENGNTEYKLIAKKPGRIYVWCQNHNVSAAIDSKWIMIVDIKDPSADDGKDNSKNPEEETEEENNNSYTNQDDIAQNPDVNGDSTQEQITDEKNDTTLPKVGNEVTVSTGVYKVTKSSAGTKEVSFVKLKSSKKSSVSIPDTIKISGFTYKVTSVTSSALENNKKVTKVTVGKNVTSIGKNAFKKCTKLKTVTVKSTSLKSIGSNAFYGDKNLKTITIKSSKLTSKSIGKNAFKGTNKKLTMKVPKKKVSSYQKFMKKKGNSKVKVTK